MVKNFISAADARQLTLTSDKLLNQAFKLIKEAATYGHNSVNFDIFEVSDTVVLNIKASLTEAGYSVEVVTDDDTDNPAMLAINW